MMDVFEWLPGDQVEWDLPFGEIERGVVVDDEESSVPLVAAFLGNRTRVRHDNGTEDGLVQSHLLRFAVPDGTYEAICEAICAGPECASDLPHRPYWHMHQAHRLVAAMARLGAIQHPTKET